MEAFGRAEQFFHAPGGADRTFVFDPFESRHIAKVLRKKTGDILYLTDGEGTVMEAVIRRADRKGVEVEILRRWHTERPRAFIRVCIAPPKSASRFEWFLEKAVELGAGRITPLRTRYGGPLRGNPERWNKIVISAIKQSKRAWKPVLDAPMTLEEVLESDEEMYAGLCEADSYANDAFMQSRHAAVIIGPEGGFAPEERALMQARGVRAVRLSDARLRTETAGVAAVAVFFAPKLADL
ncbi:MAG: 16S rRNA (uracil(1498)-N(3))-methyltransferase [Chlorobi bacterium]|nr:16S rRNA (uracil(1498)-N(3))-methyltransferase [Chlorobiota bacterium]